MKPSEAAQWIPMLESMARGEPWQQLYGSGDDWMDIEPAEELPLRNLSNYRRKPEPRRVWVRVFKDDSVGQAYTGEEFRSVSPIHGARLVEFVEVMK